MTRMSNVLDFGFVGRLKKEKVSISSLRPPFSPISSASSSSTLRSHSLSRLLVCCSAWRNGDISDRVDRFQMVG